MDFTRTQWQNVDFDPFSAQRRRDTQLFPWIARNADLITGLGDRPSRVLARYESIRAGLVSLVRSGDSTVRGDGLDGLVYSSMYGNTRFVRALLDILVHDEYQLDPSDDGDVDARHVDRAWARIAPALQAYDSLAGLRTRYGIPEAPATATADLPVRSVSTILADARAEAKTASRPDATVDLGSIGTAVRCNDTTWRKGAAYYLDEADRMAAKYPYFGYLNGVPMCAFWPYAPQDRDVDLTGSPRLPDGAGGDRSGHRLGRRRPHPPHPAAIRPADQHRRRGSARAVRRQPRPAPRPSPTASSSPVDCRAATTSARPARCRPRRRSSESTDQSTATPCRCRTAVSPDPTYRTRCCRRSSTRSPPSGSRTEVGNDYGCGRPAPSCTVIT